MSNSTEVKKILFLTTFFTDEIVLVGGEAMINISLWLDHNNSYLQLPILLQIVLNFHQVLGIEVNQSSNASNKRLGAYLIL